jgi:putative DNA primase/helicase
LEWQRSGLKTPKVVVDATATYRSEMDVLGEFLAECVELEPRARVQAKHLYGVYRTWAEESGHGAMSMRRFGLAIQERGFHREKQRTGRWYHGLHLSS